MYFSFQLLCCSPLLFFSSSRPLLNISCIFSICASILFQKFLDHLYYHYSKFLFSLPISSLFIWYCRFLPCYLVCNILFLLFFSVDGWNCVPVLLVVWAEVSDAGVCSQLGKTRCWCWDVNPQETSLQWIFPRSWGSLLVRWFRLSTPIIGAYAWSLAHEPGS